MHYTVSSDPNVSQESSRWVLSVSDCSASLWEGQARFLSLLSLLVAPLISLPCSHNLLIQPVSRLFYLTPGICRLHVWLLCNSACKRQEFLEQLPEESTHPRDLPPTICIITGGNLGWIGVSEGRWIPSILLWTFFVKFLFSFMIRNSALQQLRDIVPLFQPLLSNFPKWIFFKWIHFIWRSQELCIRTSKDETPDSKVVLSLGSVIFMLSSLYVLRVLWSERTDF